MNLPVQHYNTSLAFNLSDLRTIACGVFNKKQFFVSKIIGGHRCSSNDSDPMLLEMIPLYTISREHGVFVKKHLQNYNNVHCLLVPSKIAKEIKEEWQKNTENNHLLVCFVKTIIHKNALLHNDRSYNCIIMFPGDTIAFSSSSEQIYFKKPGNSYAKSRISIPSAIMKLLKCNTALNLNKLSWKTCNLLHNITRKEKCQQDNVAVLKSRATQTSANTAAETVTGPTATRKVLSAVPGNQNSQKVCIDVDVKPGTFSKTTGSSKSSEFSKDCRMTDAHIEEERSREFLLGRFNPKRPFEIYPRGHSTLNLKLLAGTLINSPVIHDELLEPYLRAKAYNRAVSLNIDSNVRRKSDSSRLQENSRFAYDENFLKHFQQKYRSNDRGTNYV